MSGDVVIRSEGLGKAYIIGHAHERERYTALRDVITRGVTNAWRRAVDVVHGRAAISGDTLEQIWALKDVDFEIRRGEAIGIIGRNGAGKSTLLKILSRITEPTTGRVAITGRVASLLEVGTGFHPELTGRENVFLNGAILGMRRSEIRRRFDEIVAFAEIEKFLDTPVKRYSSGMYTRLAFSVAAHLEAEILIVDEVLAVGDVEFQKKCFGRMDNVAKGGRTVLLVSHDIRKLSTLCHRGILLNEGAIELDGDMSAVANTYLKRQQGKSEAFADLSLRGDRSGNGEARVRSIELLKAGAPCKTFRFGDPLTQNIVVDVINQIGDALISIWIKTLDGVSVHYLMNINENCRWAADKGSYNFHVTIDKLMLNPGTYAIDIWVGNRYTARLDYLIDAINFTVVPDPDVEVAYPIDSGIAVVSQAAKWTCEKI